jgi:PAS domain-containing protein
MFYIKDITQRKIIEQNLIESEGTLADLFNSSPDALIVVDKEGKIVQVNPEVQNIVWLLKNRITRKGN